MTQRKTGMERKIAELYGFEILQTSKRAWLRGSLLRERR
jgi:hypothetical protein